MKPVFEFILATGNSHKRDEFAVLFDQEVIRISSPDKKIEVEETGETYVANALLKAEAYYREFKKPILSDDSGLTVEALPDELGVQSARFGGPGLNDRKRAELLLKKLELFKAQHERKAYFTCVLCFYFSPEEIYFFEGRFHGVIAWNYSELGDDFGYDPVFIPEAKQEEGRAVSELKEWKNAHSHRAIASKYAETFLKSKL
ncbi:MAG: non-canonical purine NTP pyrophosphatase [Bacteriovoracaceae bacterium]|nr:non-canonical purine NTP pyrophosphatase [Bacteriovoracaceae bacterium]